MEQLSKRSGFHRSCGTQNQHLFIVSSVLRYHHYWKLTKEWENTGDETDKEGDAIWVPSSTIHKRGKNILSSPMGSKLHKRNENTKESQNMQDQDQALNLWQPSCKESINEDDQGDDCVENQSSLPSSWCIVRVVQNY